ncbi:MAG: hypothetical protein HZB36_05770 [Candidatus Omnitrophica bacterium]|nr:hypothetical protein [Candidatus Omnitrophota bacterium]
MKKITLHKTRCLFWAIFLTLSNSTLCLAKKPVEPPKKIYYDSKPFVHNPAWENNQIYIEANLDLDPEKEIVIGFMGTYKPKDEVSGEESLQAYYMRKKNYIPIIQNLAFYQIYDKKSSGFYEAVKTITGADQIGRVFLVNTGTDDTAAIAILSPTGERAISLEIFQWRQGGYGIVANESAHVPDNNLDSITNSVAFGSGIVWEPEKNTIELKEKRWQPEDLKI